VTSYVADTHAIVWHISNDRRLSNTAKTVFDLADSGLNQIMVPSIILVEIVYLIERNRIPPTSLDRLFAILSLEASIMSWLH
jgi:PIN domain nuclease of toxin-antitoxin system